MWFRQELESTGASKKSIVREKREVAPFDRILMNDYGELIIVQGDQPSLLVETDQSLMPRIKSKVGDGRLVLGFGSWLDKLGEAFTTSMTRKPIRYTLTVVALSEIEICALARLCIDSLVTEQLRIKLCGPVDALFASLTASSLKVEMPAGGKFTVAGRVTEQDVSIGGPSEYRALKLRSDRALVNLRGAGHAVVWATDSLDVTIRGMGHVAYAGSPSLKQRIMGVGRLTPYGGRSEVTDQA